METPRKSKRVYLPKPWDVFPANQETLGTRELTDQKEAGFIVARWEKSGMLQGVDEPAKTQLACLLESQRLHNEVVSDMLPYICQFKRISIPLCRRVFTAVSGAGIEVLSPILHDRKDDPVEAVVAPWCASAPWCKNRLGETFQGYRMQHRLDEEAEAVAKFAVQITDKIVTYCRVARTDTFKFFGFGMVETSQYLLAVDRGSFGVIVPRVIIYMQPEPIRGTIT